jgi:ribosome-associated protein
VQDARSLTLIIGGILQSKYAEDIALLKVDQLTSLTDFFILCTGDSAPQLKAIANEVEDQLSSRGIEPLSVEGRETGVWILIDYGDVILHIFKGEARTFYNLDHLWGDAPRMQLSGDISDV